MLWTRWRQTLREYHSWFMFYNCSVIDKCSWATTSTMLPHTHTLILVLCFHSMHYHSLPTSSISLLCLINTFSPLILRIKLGCRGKETSIYLPIASYCPKRWVLWSSSFFFLPVFLLLEMEMLHTLHVNLTSQVLRFFSFLLQFLRLIIMLQL